MPARAPGGIMAKKKSTKEIIAEFQQKISALEVENRDLKHNQELTRAQAGQLFVQLGGIIA